VHLSRALVSLFATVILAGCASHGPLFQPATPETEKALVYIYRPGGFMLGGRDAYFYVNDKNVVDLSSEGYTYVYLDSGTYTLKQKWPFDLIGFKDLELPLNVSANKAYYFRFFSGGSAKCPSGKMCFEWTLQQVPESAALAEISQCRYQPSK
jgi:hypothetical protein